MVRLCRARSYNPRGALSGRQLSAGTTGRCLDAERPPEGGLSQKLPNRFTPFVASTSLPLPCSVRPFRADATSASASVFLLPCSHFRFRFRVPTSVFPLPLSLPCSQVQCCLELIMMVDRSPGQPTNSCLAQEKQGHDQPPEKRVNEIFSVSNRVVHNQLVSHT